MGWLEPLDTPTFLVDANHQRSVSSEPAEISGKLLYLVHVDDISGKQDDAGQVLIPDQVGQSRGTCCFGKADNEELSCPLANDGQTSCPFLSASA